MTQKLRIAMIAPVADAVTSDTGRSIERIVSLLTEDLVDRGHEVTLFATADSMTSARLCAVYPFGYDRDSDLWDWQFHETLNIAAAYERASSFDVIHSHAMHYALPFTRVVKTPTILSLHILVDPDVVRACRSYPEARVVALSHYQREVIGDSSNVEVVHHGIDTDAFPFSEASGKYLLFLGRMLPRKGPVEAVRLARAIGVPLIMAGPAEGDYFENEVLPLIDGTSVAYVGPVSPAERDELLLHAAALLYPLTAPEPFGLVMIEAMACGTPVAALGQGAVPEIVQNGVTGYVAPDTDSLLAILPDVLALDRVAVRCEAVRRFDYRRMVDDYVSLYTRVVDGRIRQAV
jgi:glycosyltransferase involved in cell wall biosynthesis